jgi:NAD(P)-dependent dehydrogenase (short-subunit alcohol dehydrogenase family)
MAALCAVEANADMDSSEKDARGEGPPTGTVAVITGAGSGIGFAAARRFGRRCRLVIADVDEARLREARMRLQQEGADVRATVCDVARADDTDRLAQLAGAQGELAVMFHSAGISPSMADARTVLTVNYAGTANILQSFLPHLAHGTVTVCVSSMSAHRRGLAAYDDLLCEPLRPEAFEALVAVARGQASAAYALSKRAVVWLVQWYARDWARRGARIFSISPGVVDTPMGRRETGGGGAGNAPLALQSAAVSRLADADEIAAVAEALCQPFAAFMTGCDVPVDGGSLAGLRCHAPQDARRLWDHPWR